MRFTYAEAMTDATYYAPLAQAAEKAGYTSMTVADSLIYPQESDSKYPYTDTGDREFLQGKEFIETMVLCAHLFAVTTTLRELRDAELARREAFAAVFAGRFSEVSFALKQGARIEAVIDAIEALDGEGGLAVAYPSDYRDCEIGVDGVDARVRCTGAALDLVFPRAGSPGELIEAFAAVRGAFAVSRALSGLIG